MLWGPGAGSTEVAVIRVLKAYPVSVSRQPQMMPASVSGQVDSFPAGQLTLRGVHHWRPSTQQRVGGHVLQCSPGDGGVDVPSEGGTAGDREDRGVEGVVVSVWCYVWWSCSGSPCECWIVKVV